VIFTSYICSREQLRPLEYQSSQRRKDTYDRQVGPRAPVNVSSADIIGQLKVNFTKPTSRNIQSRRRISPRYKIVSLLLRGTRRNRIEALLSSELEFKRSLSEVVSRQNSAPKVWPNFTVRGVNLSTTSHRTHEPPLHHAASQILALSTSRRSTTLAHSR